MLCVKTVVSGRAKISGVLAVIFLGQTVFGQDFRPAQIDLARIQTGMVGETGRCFCFRGRMRLALVALDTGQNAEAGIQSRGLDLPLRLRLRTPGLFNLERDRVAFTDRLVRQMVRAGAIDAVDQETGLGLRFNGVQFGDDADWAWTDLVSTGVAALWQLWNRPRAELETRALYEFQRYDLNLFQPIRNHRVGVGMTLGWNLWWGRGSVSVDAAVESALNWNPEGSFVQATAEQSFNFNPGRWVEVGPGIEIRVTREALQRTVGQQAMLYELFIFADLSGVLRGGE